MSYTLISSGMTGSALRTALNAVIADFDLAEARRKWLGKKAVFFGDSIWTQDTIQAELVRLTGVTYSATEVASGTGGHQPTAVAGSTIVGYSDITADQSLYKRADDVHFYSPDIIFICGGTNDNAISPPPTYTYSDAVYTGATFTSVGYDGTPSYISCAKGMLHKLVSQNPTTRIIWLGRYNYETSALTEAQKQSLEDRINADKFCADWAGVHYINGLQIGVSTDNASTYMASLAHPNLAGGILIAQAFAKAATMV